MTHDELNATAVRWLKRPISANGPGCQLALSEVGGLYGGERADAFGYRWGWDGGSVVVESKVSRSDFLADRAKPHRSGAKPGMGTYRYYICPEGLIGLDDLPHAWGLLWVNKRGHVVLKAGHVCALKACGYRGKEIEPFWQHEADMRFELDMLAHALVRFGDPEETKTLARTINREHSRLAKKCDEQAQELKNLRWSKLELEMYREKFGQLVAGKENV